MIDSKPILTVVPVRRENKRRYGVRHEPSSEFVLYFGTKREAEFVAEELQRRFGEALRVPTIEELTEIIPAETMAEIYREKTRRYPKQLKRKLLK